MSWPSDRHLTQEDHAVLREVETLLEAEGEAQTVRAKCSLCGAVNEYLPEALRLISLETTSYRLQFSFEFFCLRCHDLDTQVLGEATWMRLLDAGVPVRVICTVDEASEIWVRREEQPLVIEDVEAWCADIAELEGLPAELTSVDDNERSQ